MSAPDTKTITPLEVICRLNRRHQANAIAD
jgi:hypothetical protein